MNSKINILYVLDNLTIGGAQKQVLNIVTYINKDLFRPVICILFSNDGLTLAEQFTKKNVTQFHLRLNSWRDFRTFRKFYHILQHEQIDIIHGHTIPADFWGCLLGKTLKRCKTVYTRHNTYTPGSSWRMKSQNRILADKIISISGAITQNLITQCSTPADKIIPIANGIDTNIFQPRVTNRHIKAEFGITDDMIVIGNASRFERRKGYDIFLQVAQLITQKYENVIFFAIGHGVEKAEMLRQIEKLKLEQNVIIAEPRMDMPQIISTFDILLFTPYGGEGLPYVVLEAMAAAKPVIASNIGSNSELIIDGETGFLPNPDSWLMETGVLDPEPYARKIDYLLEHPQAARVMGDNARMRVEKYYNIHTMIKKLEQVYQELMND